MRHRPLSKRLSDLQRYGNRHQKLRRGWARVVLAGGVRCHRGADCLWAKDGQGGLIQPWEHWDLGHDDDDPNRHTGPEHRRCNRATAGRRREERKTSREW